MRSIEILKRQADAPGDVEALGEHSVTRSKDQFVREGPW
jgi:hypothetical protein